MEYNNNNNIATISGEVDKEPELSHSVFGENFYDFTIEVSRKSGNADYVPVLVSDRLVDIKDLRKGMPVKVEGEFRSFNKHSEENGKSNLILNVFARAIEVGTEEIGGNEIKLHGYICKAPKARTTPLGREIGDVMLAVNRPYGKSDYIPCITWGRNARFSELLEVGTKVDITGRVQSRVYVKENSERTAYEVSVSRIEVAD